MQADVILVADDEAIVRELVAMILKRAGFQVLAAIDGVDALTRSRAFAGPIHLLLSDVKMPRMTGPALALAIAGERPGIRIVLMSAHSDRELPPALLSGMLAKPFLPNQLVARIRRELRVA